MVAPRLSPGEPEGYGEAFADVYDQWYGERSEGPAVVDRLAELAGPDPVLELGVGTGRIALPLAASIAPVPVYGIDASASMLTQLRAKPGGGTVPSALADMAALPFGGPARFSLVFAVWNTFFNLVAPGAQERCLADVARLLAPGGRLVLETYVPARLESPPLAGFSTAMSSSRVITVSRVDPGTRVVHGSHVELIEGGVRLRPWQLLPRLPEEMDEMAVAAGMELVDRWGGWAKGPYSGVSAMHVSHYGLAGYTHPV